MSLSQKGEKKKVRMEELTKISLHKQHLKTAGYAPGERGCIRVTWLYMDGADYVSDISALYQRR